MDSAVRDRLVALIEDATDQARGGTVEPQFLRGLRSILSASDDRVAVAFDILFARLLEPNSQTRLLAVQLTDELFQRSTSFRRLLVSRFRQFIEAVIGHRPDRPLPGPPTSAEALRSVSLAAIERWREGFGTVHPQIVVAHRYLATLNFSFPEIRARAAAADAEREARTARTQQLLRDKAAAVPRSFAQLRSFAEDLLKQMAECMELLGGVVPRSAADALPDFTKVAAAGPPGSSSGAAAGAAGGSSSPSGGVLGGPLQQPEDERGFGEGMEEDDLEWEDVAEGVGGGTGLSAEELQEAEGLSGYAPAAAAAWHGGGLDGEAAPEAAAGLEPAAEVPEAVDPVILETLGGLAKQVSVRCLPPCQEWLRLLVQVDLSSAPLEEAGQRQRLLRAVIGFRNEVEAAVAHARRLGAKVDPVRRLGSSAAAGAAGGRPADGGGLAADGGITIRLDLGSLPSTSALLGTLGGPGLDDEAAVAGQAGEGAAGGTEGTLGQYQAARAARGRGRGRARGGGRPPPARKRPKPSAAAGGRRGDGAGEGGEGGEEEEVAAAEEEEEAGDYADRRRLRRALERAHNDAAISGAGDAATALRLQDAEVAAAAAAAAAKAKAKKQQTPALKKLRKLLSGK